MKKTTAPNYTQIPNSILESIHELSECEMAVLFLLCRETFGWHLTKAWLTIPEIVKKTGRSHGGITKAINSLCDRTIIAKDADPKGNAYTIVVHLVDDGSPSSGLPPVHPVDDPNKERKDLKKEDIPDAVASASLHKQFVDRWHQEYPKAHNGEPYVFSGGKDGTAVKRLMASGLTLDHLFRVANAAWARPDLFNCKQAASIAGFASRINDIRSELNAAKSKGNSEGSNRREHLSSKPVPLPTIKR